MMSSYNIPKPDYDFTVRHNKNPYIPTPDYTTFKYNKVKNRPTLNHIGTEFDRSESSQPSFENNPEIPKLQSRPPRIENSRRFAVASNRNSRPRLPDVNEDFPEFTKHSYIEDRIEEEPQDTRSTKERIKQIGVPVMPGIIPKVTPAYEAVGPVSSDQNKAFLRHLENHKKFDTVRGGSGIEFCQLCQIMRSQLEMEHQSSQYSWERENSNNRPPSSHSRSRNPDVRELFQQNDYQPEPEPYFIPVSTRARQNYERKREGELSVSVMEPVEILHKEQGFALCRKVDNNIGWIPTFVLEV